eukprot:gene4374-4627_t
MERLGAAPVLNDNLVGGNCGLLVDVPNLDRPALFISRSGKPPDLHLTAGDFVEVTSFDVSSWKACYRSSDSGLRPTSDTPLLHACLAGGSQSRHLWSSQPRVAIHGHSLAEGPELEALLSQHPYPQKQQLQQGAPELISNWVDPRSSSANSAQLLPVYYQPDSTQPPSFNDDQFILDPCDSTNPPSQSDSPQHSKKPAGAAALPKPGVVVTFPPTAQSAGQYQHEAAAAASARTTSTTTIRVDVYDVEQLQGFRQAASGIQCTWAEEEGSLLAPGSAGGTSAAYECDSCGKIIINKSCRGSDQSCALATFECAFGPNDISCSGSSCAYGHK